jgi:hypothetical protein
MVELLPDNNGQAQPSVGQFSEDVWDDQVLKEPLVFRVAAAVVHAQATLLAGFTTSTPMFRGRRASRTAPLSRRRNSSRWLPQRRTRDEKLWRMEGVWKNGKREC